MHTGEINIENISKIEGTAGLKVTLAEGVVTDLKFIVKDYKRFYTEAVKGKPFLAAPSFLSRICGTCSVAHLFAAIEAIEKSQGIVPSEQTTILRRLAYDALILRDHTLHLYFFVLPDLFGIDSILDISDDHDDPAHQLLHDSFQIKQLGTDLSTAIIGAAIHAPYPTVGGFLQLPDPSQFSDLIRRLKELRPALLRGIKVFGDWTENLTRNTDYLALRNEQGWDFLEGNVINSAGKIVPEEDFSSFMTEVVVPYSQAEGYLFSDSHEDYLVGALARINLNKEKLHSRTQADASEYLKLFPSNNIFHNCLAQALENLQCLDDAIDVLGSLQIKEEKFQVSTPHAGSGIGVIEAPRGILYHQVEVGGDGLIVNHDLIIPTAQNQINIENDLKKYFNENLDLPEDTLKLNAEKIIRAYDPCMSCATNFLKIEWIRL